MKHEIFCTPKPLFDTFQDFLVEFFINYPKNGIILK